MTKVDEAHPNRCEHIIADKGMTQCTMLSVEGGNRCLTHGGGSQRASIKKAEKKQFLQNRWHAQIKEFGTNSELRDLSMEMGTIRLLVDNLVGRCRDAYDLQIFSGQIDGLLKTLTGLARVSHGIKKDIDNVIGPEQLSKFADTLFDILLEEIKDANVINRISLKLHKALQVLEVTNDTEEF